MRSFAKLTFCSGNIVTGERGDLTSAEVDDTQQLELKDMQADKATDILVLVRTRGRIISFRETLAIFHFAFFRMEISFERLS